MNRKVFLAPLAAVAVAGALVAGGAAAHAASFTDTSVQATRVLSPSYITGDAAAVNVGLTTVSVSGLSGVNSISQPGVAWNLQAATVIDGVTVTADPVVATNSVGLTASGKPLNGGANADGTVKLTATDADGDIAVVSVPVVVGLNSVQVGTGGALTDELQSLTASNTNPDGSVTFAAADSLGALVTISEDNLPAGLVSGSPKLLPGTAVPGLYNDLTVKAVDANGATANGGFLLKVNGGPTPVAAVPVLSHGASSFVAPTRENVAFDTSITTWVHFQIVGPGAINGHEGWVNALAGSLNTAVYSGLEANHTYEVFYTPVDGSGSTVQVVGTHTGHVTFITNRP